LPFNYYHTNIATALADTYYIGKVLYPEKFTDIDPVAKADEIFMAFLGKGLYEEFVKGFGRGFGQLGDLFNCG
ncbi:MAG: iron ABC transporter substrate-binding protein, partial [Ignisphaera sp.]